MKDFEFEETIILENDRARLIPLAPEHIDPLKGLMASVEGLQRYSSIKVESEADCINYFHTGLQARADKIRYPFAIFDKKANAFAGCTSFFNIVNVNKRLEIGYTWIGTDFQQTGLNRAMKFLMLQYAFENLEYNRVEFTADSRNQPSRTAIAKIGGVFEGELRSHVILPDGYLRDTVFYSILIREWPEIKKTRFGNIEVHH